MPELAPGRVVRFRDRVWRVDAVQDATFTATPLDCREPQHGDAGLQLCGFEGDTLPFPRPTAAPQEGEYDRDANGLLRDLVFLSIRPAAPNTGSPFTLSTFPDLAVS